MMRDVINASPSPAPENKPTILPPTVEDVDLVMDIYFNNGEEDD